MVGGGGRNFPKSRQSLFKDCGREGGGFGFHDKCEKRCGRKSGSRLSGRVVGELVLRFFNKPTLTSFFIFYFILFGCIIVQVHTLLYNTYLQYLSKVLQFAEHGTRIIYMYIFFLSHIHTHMNDTTNRNLETIIKNCLGLELSQ